jgi:apolipoprotein N-acyltransferase
MMFIASSPALKNFSASTWIRYGLGAVASLLLAASFPKFNIAGFAWIAPGLLLAATFHPRGTGTFRIGYVAGLVYYFAAFHWLLLIPVTGFPILGWFALSSYLALYPALWVWLCWRIFPRLQNAPEKPRITHHASRTARFGDFIEAFAALPWTQRAIWTFSCATIWVALEMILARLFGGLPWDLLGVSQYRLVPLIQIASITGVYGVSFVVAWTSVSLLCAMLAMFARPTQRYAWMREILLPAAAVLLVFAFGWARLNQSAHAEIPPSLSSIREEGARRTGLRRAEAASSAQAGEGATHESRQLRMTLVQPSIPQTFIWDQTKDEERFRELLRLTELALTNHTDLLIWPESGIPKPLRYFKEIFQAVSGMARSNQVWLIAGSDDLEQRPDAIEGTMDPKDFASFNSSFLISPEGNLMNTYRKRSLVMWGEYIPLERWLPITKIFTPVSGSFTSGDKAVQFKLGDSGAHGVPRPTQTSVLICFEDVFPHIARASAEAETDFLVNITNDGWFGNSAAQWQHAATAVFRAVENGLPLVRCSNNGLTCWIDANGRMREIFRDANGSVYGAGFATWTIPLSPREERVRTFYNQHGDWFGWACVAFAALLATKEFAWRRKQRQNSAG